MPNRYFSSANYRFGFNGMEKDDEMKGVTGGSYTTHFRQYDPRLGRWMSKDAINYPWQSPYAAFNNNPIFFADPSGAEGEPVKPDDGKGKKGTTAPNGGKRDGEGGVIGGDAICTGCGDNGEDIYGIPSDGAQQSSQSPQQGTKPSAVKESILPKLIKKIPKPKPSSNPSQRNKIRPGSNIDEQGNFFLRADEYNELIDASLSGAEVTYLEGGLVSPLINDIHDFNDADIDFYRSLANEFLESGSPSIEGQRGVTFGPLGTTEALLTSTKAVFVMRNAQVHYSVMMTSDGDIQIAIAAYDYFDVKPTRGDNGVYDVIANPMNALHEASGANTNMQTRASWIVILKP